MSTVNANRETKTLTSPGGKPVVLKTYITPREQRPLRDIYLKNKADESTIDRIENMLIETLVVSYDGVSQGIVDMLLDSPKAEMAFVLKECQEISKDPDENDPKKPQS